jgi:peptidoglycan/LPS O-acetylase OafA/YrhL
VNLILLSFIWVAGFRLARAEAGDRTAMRDIGLIFAGHIVLAVLIKFGYCVKNHIVTHFFQHDLIDYAMQSMTLLAVFLVFRQFVLPVRSNVKRSGFLRFLGDVSYPLYLLHAAVYATLVQYGVKTPFLLYLSAVAVSAVVYQAFDFYSKRRHRQIDPGATAGQPAGAGAGSIGVEVQSDLAPKS